MVVPVRRGRVLPAAAVDCRAAPGRRRTARIDLDGFFGLHPRMAPLKPLWDNSSLAIVHACGSPDRTRSHFDAQDYMETRHAGREEHARRLAEPLPAGLGTEPSPLRGVAVARQMPRSLQGTAPSLAFGSVDAFDVRGGMDVAAARSKRRTSEADRSAAARQRAATRSRRCARCATIGRRVSARARREYPRSPFGQALQEIARVAKADVGLEVAFAESGNWDHHVNEGGAAGAARAAARRSLARASPRSPPTSASAWPTPSS